MSPPNEVDSFQRPATQQPPSCTKAQFTYQSLDLNADSIRLIKLLPGRSTEGYLQLELWHSTLPTEFSCVSYQWGDHAGRHQILLNDRAFIVGENLHAFLQEVQTWTQDGFDQPLWIDAICIDQTCVAERGHQVQRMGTIYSNAKEVFVWLGDHGELPDAFHQWLRTERSYECPQHLRQQWDTIRFNPYWSRAWIKQEILLAKRVTVALRGAQIEWTVLGGAIARSGNLYRVDDEYAAHLWSFWGARWTNQRGHDMVTARSRNELFSFWSLMHMHKTSMCTDRRDRVYSLLGLMDEEHKFPVNYEESVTDLFWRVGEHFEGWSPELVEILKVALLQDCNDREQHKGADAAINPWGLVDSVRSKQDMRVRIPIRRVIATNSLTHYFRGVKCKFDSCKLSPRLQCTRDDFLICTNARSDYPTEHGCIHAIAHPLDKPAAEPFEIRLVAHHRGQLATTTLSSTAVQVFDIGTETWVGISTWSSLQRALKMPNLDRLNHVKLSVPARYAIWIWFGVHPGQLDDAYASYLNELPSAHHALPNGTKIMRNSVEFPAA